MLGAIRQFFAEQLGAEESGTDDAHTLHMASAMLLLEVSRADFSVEPAELAVVAGILRRQFGFSGQEVDELVDLARRHSDETHSIHPFLRLLNEHCDAGEKEQMIEDLWRVAYADDRLDKYEEHQIRKIADLLYVPHATFIRTKHRVQAGE
ncbi:MAG: TerB family tellurite resistance protein [Gammaproteobacteria bacterium]|nr:TerB family tellurite resistance protein [Gammaproteobacteria bacterium]MDX5375297.1 TerB family tellurite resistance protein [Gammaproteobacteria bacterium]